MLAGKAASCSHINDIWAQDRDLDARTQQFPGERKAIANQHKFAGTVAAYRRKCLDASDGCDIEDVGTLRALESRAADSTKPALSMGAASGAGTHPQQRM